MRGAHLLRGCDSKPPAQVARNGVEAGRRVAAHLAPRRQRSMRRLRLGKATSLPPHANKKFAINFI
ncbi:hypothetical protein CBM2634_U310008 [Cupriavidus taiwanensis]|uniref:Uncharacterized protein n=1 Tax=Cupriavidus taiwanensis TaxID=164546 RepID=A0A375JF82_9BURK|nr:hypothetical protein CBM2634_U310008 [Cupriavidus taiwanensis]